MAENANETPVEKAKEKTEGIEKKTSNTNWVDDLIKGLSAGLGLTIQGYDYFTGNQDKRTQSQNEQALKLAEIQAQNSNKNNTAMTVAIFGGGVLLAILLLKK